MKCWISWYRLISKFESPRKNISRFTFIHWYIQSIYICIGHHYNGDNVLQKTIGRQRQMDPKATNNAQLYSCFQAFSFTARTFHHQARRYLIHINSYLYMMIITTGNSIDRPQQMKPTAATNKYFNFHQFSHNHKAILQPSRDPQAATEFHSVPAAEVVVHDIFHQCIWLEKHTMHITARLFLSNMWKTISESQTTSNIAMRTLHCSTLDGITFSLCSNQFFALYMFDHSCLIRRQFTG